MTRERSEDGRFVSAHAEPEPQVTPPKPATTPVLRVQQAKYDAWIAAGGTPPIYGTFTVTAGIITSTGGQG